MNSIVGFDRFIHIKISKHTKKLQLQTKVNNMYETIQKQLKKIIQILFQ